MVQNGFVSTELSREKSLRVYPNPLTSTLIVENGEGNSQIILTDFTGQVLLKQSMDRSATIDISRLVKGIYTLTVINGTGRTVRRIVKE
jgi:hypothetical protein